MLLDGGFVSFNYPLTILQIFRVLANGFIFYMAGSYSFFFYSEGL